MSMKNVERISNELFQRNIDNKRLTISNTLLIGKKDSDKNKIDCMYNRTYNSEKYSNMDSLANTVMSFNKYITLTLNDWDAKVTQEIFMSYPNIDGFKSFIEEMVEMVQSDDVFNKKNKVNVSHAEDTIESEEFPNEGILLGMPITIEKEDGTDRGIMLFVNDEDTYIELDETSILNMYYLINDIQSLTELSNQTMIMAMLFNGASGSSSGSGLSNRAVNPLKKRNIKGITSSKKKFKKKDEDEYEEDDTDDEDYDEPEEELDEEDDDENITVKRKGKTVKKSTPTKTKKTTGKRAVTLNQLMEEAEETTFDEDEEEDDEE